ncbi:hypothetical protein [Moorena sp. SIO4G3]|uniref:hypothetical protein n=1 Tax=Moorena sp. SIO4G3 TaxID=2607821 RepID=UPI00142C69E7|nr:hypothetical protein [Moorena sp. SIO4G3]NEO80547.1 hypothetical protein [Moorena sp. SIO4G3]
MGGTPKTALHRLKPSLLLPFAFCLLPFAFCLKRISNVLQLLLRIAITVDNPGLRSENYGRNRFTSTTNQIGS